MSVRIQVIVDEVERARFRARAAAEGKSLSEWLREAGCERLTSGAPDDLHTPEALDAFFAECDAREHGREPDWPEHEAVIARSRLEGLPVE